MTDLLCGICGEPRGAHVPTEDGPLTHPREARGEGRYVLIHPAYTSGGGAWHDDEEIPATYRFEPRSA